VGVAVRVRFGDFVFDSATRQLTRSGEAQVLSPKAFELLGALLECRPEARSRKQLNERLWPDTFVSRASLTWLISELRKALGDDARRPRLVRTVHRFGYAFSGEATEVSGPPAPPPATGPYCWLEWGEREIPLPEGEHFLGREPDGLVRINSPKVSRRHARILVRAGRAVLEDLGSKNGTHIDGQRIESPTDLTDRCEIWIGSEVLSFRATPATLTTETATRSKARPRTRSGPS
jgi:DNA-binding winged helix-turn-helix (wHTH) protein